MTTVRNGAGNLLFDSTRENAFEEDPWLKPLHDRLTAIGGEGVVLWSDTTESLQREATEILKFGVLCSTTNIGMRQGERNQCHTNAFDLAKKNPKTYLLFSGYFLTGTDDLWRSHSWLWNLRTKRITETTVKAMFYFGAGYSIKGAEAA